MKSVLYDIYKVQSLFKENMPCYWRLIFHYKDFYPIRWSQIRTAHPLQLTGEKNDKANKKMTKSQTNC